MFVFIISFLGHTSKKKMILSDKGLTGRRVNIPRWTNSLKKKNTHSKVFFFSNFPQLRIQNHFR